MSSFNKISYISQYKKANVKRVPLEFRLDDYAKVKAAADAAKKPVSTYIKDILFTVIDSENSGS